MPSCASVPAAEHAAERLLRLKSPGGMVIASRIVAVVIAICVSACSEDPKAVYEAVAEGDLSEVKRLVEGGAPLDWMPESGFGALHKALDDGRTDIAAYLVEKGADVDAANDPGFRPLHWAAGNGHVEVVALLLSHGARPDLVGANGRSPLDMAIVGEHLEVAELLRKAR